MFSKCTDSFSNLVKSLRQGALTLSCMMLAGFSFLSILFFRSDALSKGQQVGAIAAALTGQRIGRVCASVFLAKFPMLDSKVYLTVATIFFGLVPLLLASASRYSLLVLVVGAGFIHGIGSSFTGVNLKLSQTSNNNGLKDDQFTAFSFVGFSLGQLLFPATKFPLLMTAIFCISALLLIIKIPRSIRPQILDTSSCKSVNPSENSTERQLFKSLMLWSFAIAASATLLNTWTIDRLRTFYPGNENALSILILPLVLGSALPLFPKFRSLIPNLTFQNAVFLSRSIFIFGMILYFLVDQLPVALMGLVFIGLNSSIEPAYHLKFIRKIYSESSKKTAHIIIEISSVMGGFFTFIVLSLNLTNPVVFAVGFMPSLLGWVYAMQRFNQSEELSPKN